MGTDERGRPGCSLWVVTTAILPRLVYVVHKHKLSQLTTDTGPMRVSHPAPPSTPRLQKMKKPIQITCEEKWAPKPLNCF